MDADDGKPKSTATHRLEVEDEDAREARIHDLLQKINNVSKSQPSAGDPSVLLGGQSERPRTVDPPSELLSRVQAFLPQLAASNADLANRAREDPGSVDIENLDEEAQQYIEMNLGLGVFQARRTESRRSSSSSSLSSLSSDSNHDSPSSSSSSSSSSESGSDSQSEACSEDGVSTGRIRAYPRQRPMRPLPRRAMQRLEIVELNGDGTPRASSLPPQ